MSIEAKNTCVFKMNNIQEPNTQCDCVCGNCDMPPQNVTIRSNNNINILTPKKKQKKENKKENKNETEKCAICIDNITTNMSKTACGHIFCLTCLHEHLKTNNTCPLCRSNILDEKPAKPIKEVTLDKTLNIINEEIEQWDFERIIELCKAFPKSAKKRIRIDVEEFAYDIAKKFCHYQHYDSDEDIDLENFDSDDDIDDMDSYS